MPSMTGGGLTRAGVRGDDDDAVVRGGLLGSRFGDEVLLRARQPWGHTLYVEVCSATHTV